MDEGWPPRNIADTPPFFVHKKARAPAAETRAYMQAIA